MKTLYIVIGCDTDPDRAGFIDGIPADTLSWRGMTEGIPELKSSLKGLTDRQGHEPVFTWLLRVDDQIKAMYGAFNWVLTEHQSFLADLEDSGDELGWHPHFWRQDTQSQSWFQETADVSCDYHSWFSMGKKPLGNMAPWSTGIALRRKTAMPWLPLYSTMTQRNSTFISN